MTMTSAPAIELKPCPFCGSPAQSTQWTGRMADDCFPHYSIHCTNGEDCWGSNHAHLGSDLAETVAAWNRRSLDSADLDANEIWEFLFGEMRGAVPEELTNEILAALSAYIDLLNQSDNRPSEEEVVDAILAALASPPSPAQSAIVPPVVEVTEEMVEAAARAMCTRHYAQRFRKLEADEHVVSNVDANWHLFRDDALAALQAQHRGE